MGWDYTNLQLVYYICYYMLLHVTILLYMLLYIYVTVCICMLLNMYIIWTLMSQPVALRMTAGEHDPVGAASSDRRGRVERTDTAWAAGSDQPCKSWTKRTNQYHSNGGYTYWNIRFLVGVNNTNTICLVGVQPFFCCTPILQHARCCPPCFFFDLNPVVMVLAGFSRLVLLNSSYHQIHQMPSVFPTQMYQGWLASWMKRCTASQLHKPVENAPQRWAWPSGAWSSIYGHVL